MIWMVQAELDIRAAAAPQAFQRVALIVPDRLHPLVQLGERLHDDRAQDGILILEIEVDRPRCASHALRDLAHADVCIPLRHEEVARSRQDLVPQFLPQSVSPCRRHISF